VIGDQLAHGKRAAAESRIAGEYDSRAVRDAGAAGIVAAAAQRDGIAIPGRDNHRCIGRRAGNPGNAARDNGITRGAGCGRLPEGERCAGAAGEAEIADQRSIRRQAVGTARESYGVATRSGASGDRTAIDDGEIRAGNAGTAATRRTRPARTRVGILRIAAQVVVIKRSTCAAVAARNRRADPVGDGRAISGIEADCSIAAIPARCA